MKKKKAMATKTKWDFLWKNKKLRILILVCFLLILIRILLPSIVLHFANKRLANMNGYFGHIMDVDIALFRGAYVLKDIYINKVDEKSTKQSELFSSRIIDLSLEWKALFHRRIVGELQFFDPILRFEKDKAEPGQIQKDSSDFRSLLKSFMPLKVNRFEINNGEIKYIDESSKPSLDLHLTQAHVLAQNLTNAIDSSLLPSKVNAEAKLYHGDLDINISLNALAKDPTFDLNTSLKNTNLPELNDLFKAYGNVDVNKGVFGLYIEVASKQGVYTGYVKPVIRDLDVLGPEDRHDTILQKLWEGIVGTSGVILTNPSKKQVATKIDIEGDLSKSKVHTLDAIITLLRNAFIRALMPSIENSINIYSVEKSEKENKKGFFEKLFSKDDKQKK